MIKRAFILFITLLYLGTAMGVGLNFHYCFGRIASVKLYESRPDCKFLKFKKIPKCCKSKQLTVKVKDSHQQTKADFALNAAVADRLAVGYAGSQLNIPVTVLSNHSYRGPPPMVAGSCPLFIKNCTFRI